MPYSMQQQRRVYRLTSHIIGACSVNDSLEYLGGCSDSGNFDDFASSSLEISHTAAIVKFNT